MSRGVVCDTYHMHAAGALTDKPKRYHHIKNVNIFPHRHTYDTLCGVGRGLGLWTQSWWTKDEGRRSWTKRRHVGDDKRYA